MVLWAKADKQNINHIADIRETIAKQLWAASPTPSRSLSLSPISLMFILTFDFDVHLLCELMTH